jgi:Ran GTPase-activating protein (RanGAP) involved in mRNA processing and transport
MGGSAKSCNALLTRVEANDPTLTELVILPTKTFGAAEVERLAAAIGTGKNTHLKSLSASGHAIPPNSLVRLGTAISLQKSGLVRISIGHQSMGDEGVVALCAGLKDSLLEEVDLVWKDLSTNGMAALGKTFGPSRSLRKLILSRNERLKDEGIIALCTSASTRCKELDRVAFSALQELDLAVCGVGSAGVQSLAQLLQTTADNSTVGGRSLSLTLSANLLGHDACNSLAPLLCDTLLLSSLSLANCNIGNEGTNLLCMAVTSGQCNSLKTLDLSDNDIGAEGAAALGKSLWNDNAVGWTQLVDLRLAGNNLSASGVKNVMDALTSKDEDGKNQTLQSLDLTQTNCGVDGAAAALQCQSLSSLRLFNNKLGAEGFQRLANELKGGHASLVNLDLGGNDASEASVVELLTALTQDGQGFASKLRLLEIGGNQGGHNVEEAVKKLKQAYPELDVARDRPKQATGAS